ncbi:hypothetical protein RUND412_005652 [Rhizina undulata]
MLPSFSASTNFLLSQSHLTGSAGRNAGPSVSNETSGDTNHEPPLNTLDGVNMTTVVNIIGASNFPKPISSRSKFLKYIAVGLHVDIKELADKLDTVFRTGEAKAGAATYTPPELALGDVLATIPAGNRPSIHFSPALHHLLNAMIQPHRAPGVSDVTEKSSSFIESCSNGSLDSCLSESLEAPPTGIYRNAMNSFSTAAPTIPDAILEQSGIGLMDYDGTGQTLVEYSAMESNYCGVLKDADLIVRKLLGIQLNDDTWTVLFLPGDESLHYAAIVYNLLSYLVSKRLNFSHVDGNQDPVEYVRSILDGVKADYIYTGSQSSSAGMDAHMILGLDRVNVAANARKFYGTADHQSIHRTIPKKFERIFTDKEKSLFTFFRDCEPSSGVGFKNFPEALENGGVVVCDMGSNIFTKTIGVDNFHVIADMKHSIGPPGTTLVLARTEILDNQAPPVMMHKLGLPTVPSSISWSKMRYSYWSGDFIAPVMNIFTTNLILNQIFNNGGIDFAHLLITNRSELLYKTLERYNIYHVTAARHVRAHTFICWKLGPQPPIDKVLNKRITREFLQDASEHGLYNLSGNKDDGGVRVGNCKPLISRWGL